MSCLNKDNFIRCHEALHVICSSVLPCIITTIQKWHTQMQQPLGHCTSRSQCGSVKGKPKAGPTTLPGGIPQPQSCSSCVAWGKAILDVEYTNPAKGIPSSITWSNVKPHLLSKDSVEVAKAFVLRLPKVLPSPKTIDEFDTAGLLMIMMKLKPFHQGDWDTYVSIKEVFDIRNSLAHLKQKDNLYISDETMETNLRRINRFMERLHRMHHKIYNFAKVFDMRVKLNNVRTSPITSTMRHEALKPITEAVKEVVRETLKEEFEELKLDLRLGCQDIHEKEKAIHTLHEEFDVSTFKQDLIGIYEEELGRMLLLPWNDEFSEMRFMDDIYVELELLEDKTTLKTNAELVELKTRQDKLAKRVMLKGLPGSGKSCLMSKLAYEWSKQNPKSPLYKFELVFLLRVRDLRTGQSLTDAICQQILKIESALSGLTNYIEHHQEKILILADGLDEGDVKVQSKNLPKLTEEISIEQILANEALRKCQVIVSSRPHKHLGAVQTKYYSAVEIRGFSPDKVNAYIGKFFYGKENAEKLVEGLIEKIRGTHLLRAMSKVPMVLMLLCLLWEDQISFPDTITMLYQEFVGAMWKRFCLKDGSQKVLSNTDLPYFLGKIALRGLLPTGDATEDVLEFPEEEFESTADYGLKVGLLTKQRWKFRLEEKTSVSFLHKSIQEFCAGKYLADLFTTNRGVFNKILCQIASWELVLSKFELLRFSCGLSQQLNEKALATTIIEYIISKYKVMVEIRSISRIEVLTKIDIGSNKDTDVFPLLALLYEGQMKPSLALDSSFKDHILPDVESVKIHCGHPQALTIFQYFQSGIGRELSRNIKSIGFRHASCGSFDTMSEIMQFMPYIDELDISGMFDNGNSDSMTRLSERISSYSKLSKLRLNDETNSTLNSATILAHLSTELLKYIELSKVIIGDAIKHLRSAITHHLQHLILLNAALQEKHIVKLSTFLPNAPNISVLDLSWNAVGMGVVQLAHQLKHCHRLQRLNLSDAHLTSTGIEELAESFQYWPDFRRIDLRSNDEIGNIGLDAVLRNIHRWPKLTELQLSTRIDSYCSDLVRKCLRTIETAVPDESCVVRIHAWENEILCIQRIGKSAFEL